MQTFFFFFIQWITKMRHYLEVPAHSTDETISKLYSDFFYIFYYYFEILYNFMFG